MKKPNLAKVFFFTSLLLYFLLLSSSYAQIPHLINYQGKLTDTNGNPVADGNHSVTFRIYDADAGGNLLWEETQSILIQKGLFSCLLGGVTNLDLAFDKPYWLAIKVGSDAEMTPRQQITSSGYAIRAERAEDVDSVPSGLIVMWSGSITAIPAGWALCDGGNGTPDLRDRFIVGAGSSYNPGVTGGENTHVLTINEIPAHTHTYNQGSSLTMFLRAGQNSPYTWQNHSTGSTGLTGGGQAHENRPPYYALAYIIKL